LIFNKNFDLEIKWLDAARAFLYNIFHPLSSRVLISDEGINDRSVHTGPNALPEKTWICLLHFYPS